MVCHAINNRIKKSAFHLSEFHHIPLFTTISQNFFTKFRYFLRNFKNQLSSLEPNHSLGAFFLIKQNFRISSSFLQFRSGMPDYVALVQCSSTNSSSLILFNQQSFCSNLNQTNNSNLVSGICGKHLNCEWSRQRDKRQGDPAASPIPPLHTPGQGTNARGRQTQ